MRELLIRIRIVFISAFFILFITGFLVFPKAVSDLALALEEQESGIRLLLVILAVLADAALVFIIYQELRTPLRKYNEDSLPVRARGSHAEISMESVKQNLNSQLMALDDIFSVQTDVESVRGRVAVDMNINARDTVNIKRKTSLIQREIKKIVERQLGLKLDSTPTLHFELSSTAKVHLAEPPPKPTAETDSKPKKSLFGRAKDQVPENDSISAKAEPAPPPEEDNDTVPLIDPSSVDESS